MNNLTTDDRFHKLIGQLAQHRAHLNQTLRMFGATSASTINSSELSFDDLLRTVRALDVTPEARDAIFDALAASESFIAEATDYIDSAWFSIEPGVRAANVEDGVLATRRFVDSEVEELVRRGVRVHMRALALSGVVATHPEMHATSVEVAADRFRLGRNGGATPYSKLPESERRPNE